MMKRRLLLGIGLACLSVAAGAAAITDRHLVPGPRDPRDEQAVYEAVLAKWLRGGQGLQLVDVELSAPPSPSDRDIAACVKGLDFPKDDRAKVGRRSLAGIQFKTAHVQLIEGSQWKPVDPGRSMAAGKPVEAAVEEGVSHSLIALSQITFGRDGKDALVRFSMRCGMLCGTGSTLHLHKSEGRWMIARPCGGEWIS